MSLEENQADLDIVRTARTDLRVIAVQNYGSSGSVFLHSLFDSHPQVLVLPGPYGIQYYVSWSIYVENASATGVNFQGIRGWVLRFFEGLVDPASTYQFGLTDLGDEKNQHASVDRSRFERIFDALIGRMAAEEDLPAQPELNAENVGTYQTVFLKAIYLAYAICAGQSIQRKAFILYPAHSSPMRDIGPLCEDFKDVSFVHMVREPINNLDSMQRLLMDLAHSTQPHLDVFSCVVNQMFYDRAPQAPVCGVPLYSIYPYPTAPKDGAIAVRLEDLHAKSHATLNALCRRLGIAWDDCLLESTFAGKKWWSRPGMRRVNGFSEHIVGRTPQFGRFDQWRFRNIGASIRSHFGYMQAGERRSPMTEACALMLSMLLPFGLEFKCFNISRYEPTVQGLASPEGPLAPVVRLAFRGRNALKRLRARVQRLARWDAPASANVELASSENLGDPATARTDFQHRRGMTTAIVLALLAPPLFLRDYFEHRLTMYRGFALNRAGTTRFVELLRV